MEPSRPTHRLPFNPWNATTTILARTEGVLIDESAAGIAGAIMLQRNVAYSLDSTEEGRRASYATARERLAAGWVDDDLREPLREYALDCHPDYRGILDLAFDLAFDDVADAAAGRDFSPGRRPAPDPYAAIGEAIEGEARRWGLAIDLRLAPLFLGEGGKRPMDRAYADRLRDAKASCEAKILAIRVGALEFDRSERATLRETVWTVARMLVEAGDEAYLIRSKLVDMAAGCFPDLDTKGSDHEHFADLILVAVNDAIEGRPLGECRRWCPDHIARGEIQIADETARLLDLEPPTSLDPDDAWGDAY